MGKNWPIMGKIVTPQVERACHRLWVRVPPMASTDTTGECGYHQWMIMGECGEYGYHRWWVRVPPVVSTGTTGGEYGYHRCWVRVPPVVSTGTTGGEYGCCRYVPWNFIWNFMWNFQCKSCETPVELHVELHVELPVELCGTFRLIYIDMYNTRFVYIRCQNKTPRPFFDLRPDFNSWHPENSKNASRLPIR